MGFLSFLRMILNSPFCHNAPLTVCSMPTIIKCSCTDLAQISWVSPSAHTAVTGSVPFLHSVPISTESSGEALIGAPVGLRQAFFAPPSHP